MEAKPEHREHVTFRPGHLVGRLTEGPLTPGATAKRDLARYYVLLDDAFDVWWNRTGMWEGPWDVVLAFVAAQGWETTPTPAVFRSRFDQFRRSPSASRMERAHVQHAYAAVSAADFIEIVAVLDRAERCEITPSQDGATAGATSAAS